MKKYILMLITSSMLFVYCNNRSHEIAKTKIATVDTTARAADGELMQVSALSPSELKDDSVFTNGQVPTTWKIAHITNVKGLKLFIKQLQQAIIVNDKEQLASAVQYPLDDFIKTKESLLANYDAVFTKTVKLSLATTNFNQLFRSQKGVMLDGSKIWIAQKGDNFKIISINYADSK